MNIFLLVDIIGHRNGRGIMNLEELLKNQWEIDKIFEKVKFLNETHNKFLDSKNKGKSSQKNEDSEIKDGNYRTFYKKLHFCYTIALTINIFLLINNIIGSSAYLGIFSGATIIKCGINVVYLFKNKNKEDSKKLLDKVTVENCDDSIYLQLCETRELYRQMVNEQEAKVAVLKREDYDEYMKLLEEYNQVVEAIKQKYSEENLEPLHSCMNDEDPAMRVLGSKH